MEKKLSVIKVKTGVKAGGHHQDKIRPPHGGGRP
jgi:hypothetical protein